MPSQWLEISTEAPGEYAEPLTHLFARYGEGGAFLRSPAFTVPESAQRWANQIRQEGEVTE